jgi:hypothetical protein
MFLDLLEDVLKIDRLHSVELLTQFYLNLTNFVSNRLYGFERDVNV